MEPEVPCLGDTLTFTLSGVVDEGGIKRVDCYAKTVVPPVGPSYMWIITKPDATTVSGSGAAGTVLVDILGNYSCTFTATASRECPPAPLTVSDSILVRVPTAELTPDPGSIPAHTGAPIPNYAFTDISVFWNPPDCPLELRIERLEGDNGYVPPNEGVLFPLDVNLWRYVSFSEPQTEKHPQKVDVWIAAYVEDLKVTEVKVVVMSVHKWWTAPQHQHGPGQPTHNLTVDDLLTDYNYLRWKYATVLDIPGSGFWGQPTITLASTIPCGDGDAYACTQITDSVEFGSSTFSGSEHKAVSIIGHELVHTIEISNQSECAAYTWEIQNQANTGINADQAYLQSVGQEIQIHCPGP